MRSASWVLSAWSSLERLCCSSAQLPCAALRVSCVNSRPQLRNMISVHPRRDIKALPISHLTEMKGKSRSPSIRGSPLRPVTGLAVHRFCIQLQASRREPAESTADHASDLKLCQGWGDRLCFAAGLPKLEALKAEDLKGNQAAAMLEGITSPALSSLQLQSFSMPGSVRNWIIPSQFEHPMCNVCMRALEPFQGIVSRACARGFSPRGQSSFVAATAADSAA